MQILKHRRSGKCPLVAVMNFDVRTKLYQPSYSLGRSAQGGTKWEPLKPGDSVPFWAQRGNNHRFWDAATTQPHPQAELVMPQHDDVPHAATGEA